MASTEAGHHGKRVYISQEGHLVVPSSGAIKVEAGGIMAVKPSTGGLSAIYTTGKTGTLSNRGVSVIRTTALGVLALAQPTKDTIGATKTIVIDTTAGVKIRLATAAGLMDVRCGSSSASVIIPTTDTGKLIHKTIPTWGVIQLLAASTDRWILTNLRPDMSTGAKYWIFSSCT